MASVDLPAGDSSAPEADPLADPVGDARAAVHVGLYVSGLRCMLQYVVAPAVGAFGVVLGPIGFVLQVLGTVTATFGALRLWRLGHRFRVPYAVVAVACWLLAFYALAEMVGLVG
ncbi:MAG: hypothetical protein QM714_08120 [Nocardioides sp.]|uniref:hypothetical protein n=1 Tax=Nocardioides sp. TaxID=35761 RepID=UPI0039E34F8C